MYTLSAETIFFFMKPALNVPLRGKDLPKAESRTGGSSRCYNLNPSLYLFPNHLVILGLLFLPFKRKSCSQKISHNSNKLSAGKLCV